MNFSDEQQIASTQIDSFIKEKNGAFVLTGAAGCVDNKTEFLTPHGWKLISEFDNDEVAMFDPKSGCVTFTTPIEYVKKTMTEKFKSFECNDSIQILSDEHRVLYYTTNDEYFVESAANISEKIKSNSIDGFIKTTFSVDSTDYHKSLDLYLLDLILIKYQHLTHNNTLIFPLSYYNTYKFITDILDANNCNYSTYFDVFNGNFNISIEYLDEMLMKFRSERYSLCPDVLKFITTNSSIIGSNNEMKSPIYSKNKYDVDFLQYAYAACGVRTVVKKIHDFFYLQMITKPTLPLNEMKIDDYSDHDGFKYCFTVETSFWVARRNGSIFITGNTGKSTLLSEKIKEFRVNGRNVKVCAPTGKAASVLINKGLKETGTIHSLIYTPELDDNGNLKGFIKNNSVFADLIVVDECGMVSREIFDDLSSFNVPLLFVGDGYQLPPISTDDDDFNITNFPDYTLNEVLRTSLDNPITRLATEIRKTGHYDVNNYLTACDNINFYAGRLNRNFLCTNNFDVILCATNKKRLEMNTLLRSIHGFDSEHAIINDIVICLKNTVINGKKIYNGERFRVVDVEQGYGATIKKNRKRVSTKLYKLEPIDTIGDAVLIENVEIPDECWDGEITHTTQFYENGIGIFEFGYAITVWKAQGSEFKSVLFLDENIKWVDRLKYRYTAVTRATQFLTIIR